MLFSGQGVQLSGNVPFVIFEWLVWELPADNQRVSDSVFKVKRIIYIVRWKKILTSGDGAHNLTTDSMPLDAKRQALG